MSREGDGDTLGCVTNKGLEQKPGGFDQKAGDKSARRARIYWDDRHSGGQ